MKKLTSTIDLSNKEIFPTDIVVIKFGSEDCGPCRALDAKLEQLCNEIKGAITIAYVDINKDPTIATEAMSSGLITPFMSIPMTFVFKNWERLWNGILGDKLNEITERYSV